MRRILMLVVPGALAVLVLASVVWAASGGTPRVASLTGAAEVPTAGDPDGSGSAVVRVNLGQKRVCWQLAVKDVGLPATAAHIHAAATGVAGPVVVTLGAPDAAGKASGCTAVTDRALLKALIQKPAGYYVNVHNATYPAGAVRGQLAKPGSGGGKPATPGKPDVKPGKPVK